MPRRAGEFSRRRNFSVPLVMAPERRTRVDVGWMARTISKLKSGECPPVDLLDFAPMALLLLQQNFRIGLPELACLVDIPQGRSGWGDTNGSSRNSQRLKTCCMRARVSGGYNPSNGQFVGQNKCSKGEVARWEGATVATCGLVGKQAADHSARIWAGPRPPPAKAFAANLSEMHFKLTRPTCSAALNVLRFGQRALLRRRTRSAADMPFRRLALQSAHETCSPGGAKAVPTFLFNNSKLITIIRYYHLFSRPSPPRSLKINLTIRNYQRPTNDNNYNLKSRLRQHHNNNNNNNKHNRHPFSLVNMQKSSDSWGTTGGNVGGGGGGRSCYNCGDPNHLSRDCEAPRRQGGGGGGGGRSCYNCGEPGHLSRECQSPRKQGGMGDNGGGRVCYNCNQPGHLSRECQAPKKDRGGNDGGGRSCYNCGGPDHLSRDCTQPRKQGGGGGGRSCYNCGDPGHLSRDCQQLKSMSK